MAAPAKTVSHACNGGGLEVGILLEAVPVTNAFVLIYQSCVYLSNRLELPTNTHYASRNELDIHINVL